MANQDLMKKPPGSMGNFWACLTGKQDEFMKMLPKHITWDGFSRAVLLYARTNPKVLTCELGTIVHSLLVLAQAGLPPDGTLGMAYIVPYWSNKRGMNEAQPMFGYKGLIELAYRSGRIANVEAEWIGANDDWDYCQGLERIFYHRKAHGERGALIGAYSIARFKDGSPSVCFMTKHEIDKIRQGSAAFRKGFGPWVDNYEAMALKTAVRRHMNLLPKSSELEHVMRVEAIAESGAQIPLSKEDLLAEVTIPDAQAPEGYQEENVVDVQAESAEDKKAKAAAEKKAKAAQKRKETLAKKKAKEKAEAEKAAAESPPADRDPNEPDPDELQAHYAGEEAQSPGAPDSGEDDAEAAAEAAAAQAANVVERKKGAQSLLDDL